MNRYTILVKADRLKQVIPIPPEFENRELQVIISIPEKKKFDASMFKSIFNFPKDEIDRDVEIMRSEWNKN